VRAHARSIAGSVDHRRRYTIAPSDRLDLQALCKSMDLVGFIDPHVGWMDDDDTVSAEAQAAVVDCHGNQFYQGQASCRGRCAGNGLCRMARQVKWLHQHADPKGTNAKLHTSAETFNALRQSLNVEFPQISARSPHAKSPE